MQNKNIKTQNQDFFWYALNISNHNIDDIIEQIKSLQTKRISQIINLSKIFTQSKTKNRVIFIEACLTYKLKQAILEITGIRHFIPKNSAPYVFCDLEDFLKYHFHKNEVDKIKSQYLHKHEVNDPESIVYTTKTAKKNTDLLTKYNIGDMVLITNHGIFKEHIGIITDIKDDILFLNIQINSGKANISTSLCFSDTELIKQHN